MEKTDTRLPIAEQVRGGRCSRHIDGNRAVVTRLHDDCAPYITPRSLERVCSGDTMGGTREYIKTMGQDAGCYHKILLHVGTVSLSVQSILSSYRMSTLFSLWRQLRYDITSPYIF